MDFYKVIEERKSFKSFENASLHRDKIQRMINAAMMAPSWKNNTSYKFIIVEDQEEKAKIADCIINSSNEASKAVKEAPMLALVVSDPSKSGEVAERQYYMVDAAIAMEHFILAATAEGYGTCWLGAIDEDKIRTILNIPEIYRVVAMTPVGVSKENKNHNEKKDTRDYVFLNSWDNPYTGNIRY